MKTETSRVIKIEKRSQDIYLLQIFTFNLKTNETSSLHTYFLNKQEIKALKITLNIALETK